MVPTAGITEHIPIIAAIGALALGSLLACIARPRYLFVFLGISLVAGQLARLPLLGQSGGLLLSDVVVALSVLVVFFSYIFGVVSLDELRFSRKYWILILPFIAFSLLVLAVRVWGLSGKSIAITVLYWSRLALVLFMLPLFSILIQRKQSLLFAQRIFIATFIVLVSLGYLQLYVFPSLVGISGGWDPHIRRMVSTWLDPNFFGAFIVITLPFAVCWARVISPVKTFMLRFLLVLAGLLALLLTHSRSSLLAAGISSIVVVSCWLFTASLSRDWKKIVYSIVAIGIVLLSFVFVTFGQRAFGVFRHDPTVSLRVEAYRHVWHRLVEPNILFGVGYNAYQFTAKKEGVIESFAPNSRAGSDSSIFTLLVTTGIVGTTLFFAPIFYGLHWHGVRWISQQRTASLLFIWSTVALLVHSQFENSLLYPHLLITYLLIAILTTV